MRLKKKHEEAIESIPPNKREKVLLSKAQKELEHQNLMLINYENQMKSLAKVLGIKLTGTDEDWKNIIDQTLDAKYKAAKAQQLEIENEKLKSDIKIALEELDSLQEKKSQEDKSIQKDGVNMALQKLLHNERQQNQENTTIIYKLRQKVM